MTQKDECPSTNAPLISAVCVEVREGEMGKKG